MPGKQKKTPDLSHADVDTIAEVWAKELKDKDANVKRLAQKLLLVGLAICRESEIWSKKFELTRGEMALVMALRRAGDKRVRPTDLLVFLSMSSAGVTKQLGSLESRGLITRQLNPDHRGGFLVSLTESGQALASRIRSDKTWGPITAALSALSSSDRKGAEKLFDTLLDAAHDGAEQRKSRAKSKPTRIGFK